MGTKILRLNKAGIPTAWIGHKAAAIAQAKGQVIWSMGEIADTMRGGYNHNGERSRLDLPAIIAVDGRIKDKSVPKMTNRLLFARDQNICMYCGDRFKDCDLTRDHVHPTSRGGLDVWENCVASCQRCNHFKSNKLLSELDMQLLAVPFAPNLYEWFYLSNRGVLADQMHYLSSKFKNVTVAQ